MAATAQQQQQEEENHVGAAPPLAPFVAAATAAPKMPTHTNVPYPEGASDFDGGQQGGVVGVGGTMMAAAAHAPPLRTFDTTFHSVAGGGVTKGMAHHGG